MKRSGYRGAHQKAAVESVHFPLWTYNPTTGKVKLDSADKSDTVSFAKNAVSKELGENRAGAGARFPKKSHLKIPSHTCGGIFGIILAFC